MQLLVEAGKDSQQLDTLFILNHRFVFEIRRPGLESTKCRPLRPFRSGTVKDAQTRIFWQNQMCKASWCDLHFFFYWSSRLEDEARVRVLRLFHPRLDLGVWWVYSSRFLYSQAYKQFLPCLILRFQKVPWNDSWHRKSKQGNSLSLIKKASQGD